MAALLALAQELRPSPPEETHLNLSCLDRRVSLFLLFCIGPQSFAPFLHLSDSQEIPMISEVSELLVVSSPSIDELGRKEGGGKRGRNTSPLFHYIGRLRSSYSFQEIFFLGREEPPSEKGVPSLLSFPSFLLQQQGGEPEHTLEFYPRKRSSYQQDTLMYRSSSSFLLVFLSVLHARKILPLPPQPTEISRSAPLN